MVLTVGYIKTDAQSVIIKHPKSQPRQIHKQKNNDFFSANLSSVIVKNGKNRGSRNLCIFP
jgi:hypothetical protein